ncbi:MAG: NAD(P)/FAD-dependent oxidoreductase [Thermoplasmata archaeon]|nr:NAD(P)/FAD-dependent oxidoreductase [Thermoplasmata archaeon]
MSALQAIRKYDTESEITIISRERFPAYSPCSLPNLLANELDDDKIMRFEPDFYTQQKASFIKNVEAVEILPETKEILLADGNKLKWDRLLVAAGASPIVPRGIEGLDLEGVHIMGTLDSTMGIREHCERGVENAVVVGGGFIGIETAVMLRKRGIDVVVVEMLPRILSRMLDPDVSEHVEAMLENKGMVLRTGSMFKGAFGSGTSVEQVKIDDEMVDCDMLVIAIGVSPNTRITKNSGIGTDGGILVDTSMRTNIEDIYAAGDIAVVKEQIGGLAGSYMTWPNAIEQGRIAGLNMAGQEAVYNGAELINVLDIFDMPVVTMGYTSSMAGDCENITWSSGRELKKILLKDDKIIGLQFVNSIRNAGTLYALMKEGSFVGNIGERLVDDNLVISLDTLPDFQKNTRG